MKLAIHRYNSGQQKLVTEAPRKDVHVQINIYQIAIVLQPTLVGLNVQGFLTLAQIAFGTT